jgi:2-polyprenyl-3-methyl-5-hydroxy-6-metoxy-1,4-benzoquinol methylase
MTKRFLAQTSSGIQMNRVQRDTKIKFLRAIEEGIITLIPRQTCICGSTEAEKIAGTDRFGLDFSSYLCRECGVMFTSPYISEESISLYYQEYYHPLTFGTHTPKAFLFARGQGVKIFHFVKTHLHTNTVRVFEMGAGSGSNLLEFAKESRRHGFVADLSGIEFNAQYVAKGREMGVHLRAAPLEELLRGEPGTFDLIILSHVLEHFPDIKHTLNLLKKLAHPETLFYIEVPGVLDLKTRYEYNCDFLHYLTHAHTFNFSLHSLASTLQMYSLELVSGNEKIESIFTIKSVSPENRRRSNYQEIITYLCDLENNLAFYQSKNPGNSLYRILIKKIAHAIDSIIPRTSG